MDNIIKSTISNVEIIDSGIERAKEIMANFGESKKELDSIVSVSKFLKFDAQIQNDFFNKNGIVISYELYNIMKRYDGESVNYTFRNEYHIFWTRNEIKENGKCLKGDYVPFSGYSGEKTAVEKIRQTEKLFEDFKNGKLNNLAFFGLYFI